MMVYKISTFLFLILLSSLSKTNSNVLAYSTPTSYHGICSTTAIATTEYIFKGSYWYDTCGCMGLYSYCSNAYCPYYNMCDWPAVVECTCNFTLANSFCGCPNPSNSTSTYADTIITNTNINITKYFVDTCTYYSCENHTKAPYECDVEYESYTSKEYKSVKHINSIYNGFSITGMVLVVFIGFFVACMACIFTGRILHCICRSSNNESYSNNGSYSNKEYEQI